MSAKQNVAAVSQNFDRISHHNTNKATYASLVTWIMQNKVGFDIQLSAVKGIGHVYFFFTAFLDLS